MTKDEQVSKDTALKMAIEGYEECLENLQGWAAYAGEYFENKWDLEGEVKAHKDRINSCKEALEQSAQEPVSKTAERDYNFMRDLAIGTEDILNEMLSTKPVAWLIESNEGGHWIHEVSYEGSHRAFPVYTHPAPQPSQNGFDNKVWIRVHPWQGLTDDDVQAMWKFYDGKYYDFYTAIEAKLKEKNT